MSGRITELGSVLFAADGSEGTYRNIIKRLDLKPPILVKPNWSGSDVFTEKEILDWTLSAINSEVLVVESYAHFRSPLLAYREGPFDSALEEKLTKQKKKDLRANDKWFGEYSGCTEILEKHNVEYLNLSEELWANRVCDSDVIKEEVNSQFDPIKEEVFYSMVPTRLYELKGGTLLSIA
ncbi:MAG: hypothetical protein ACFE7R_07930, partial [Candidatus Hodarchaeota archaeon]